MRGMRGEQVMKVLKKDCGLVIKDHKTYIQSGPYMVPVSAKGALFIAMLDGKRSFEEAMEIMRNIQICSSSAIETLHENMVNQYGLFLEEDNENEENKNRHYNPIDFIIPQKEGEVKLDSELPRTLLYHATSSCDKACRYCYLSAKRGAVESDALTYEEIVPILNDAAQMGIYLLILSGGEPFIRKDLIDIIEYASKLGMRIHITTKFYLNDEQIERMSHIKNLELFISYDIHIDEIASYLVGSPNHAKKMVELLIKLNDAGIKFTVVPVVTGLTAPYFTDFINHLYSFGVERIILSRYAPSFGRNDDELVVTDEQWAAVMEAMDVMNNSMLIDINVRGEIKDELALEHPYDYTNNCVNGRWTLPVLPDGKAVLCDEIPNRLDFCFGDLRKSSIYDIWKSEERKKIVFPSKEFYANTSCHDCEDFDRCLKKRSCVNASLLESSSAYIPVYDVRESCKNYEEAVHL